LLRSTFAVLAASAALTLGMLVMPAAASAADDFSKLIPLLDAKIVPAQVDPDSLSVAVPTILPRWTGATALISGELVPAGSASTQMSKHLSSYPAPGLRVALTLPMFDHLTSVMAEFDDRELAGRAGISGCSDAITSIPCVNKRSENFNSREWTVQEHTGFRVPSTPVFLAFANLYRASNYTMDIEGIGFGAEVLPPMLRNGKPSGLFGSAYFFPNIMNEHLVATNTIPVVHVPVRYSMVTYEIGTARRILRNTPAFVDYGIRGDHSWSLVNAPKQGTKLSLFAGTGASF
jgi:hypothetical protein